MDGLSRGGRRRRDAPTDRRRVCPGTGQRRLACAGDDWKLAQGGCDQVGVPDAGHGANLGGCGSAGRAGGVCVGAAGLGAGRDGDAAGRVARWRKVSDCKRPRVVSGLSGQALISARAAG
ncbi:hypothetical protein G6F24_017576 [Rhizopus arrhizus]|nr:hypothetical protein G6F24_017576 [Rhizopus arrhizus]